MFKEVEQSNLRFCVVGSEEMNPAYKVSRMGESDANPVDHDYLRKNLAS